MQRVPDSRAYWDRAAVNRPAWYIATGHQRLSPAFFEHGAREVDELLRFCGLQVGASDRLVELGCGAGRMTGRLAELAGQVVAVDVSPKMLDLARQHLAGATNVEFLLGGGRDLRPLADASVDVVFSYVTLQHVPTRADQCSYLRETCRVLRPGGRAALQLRAPGLVPAALDLLGQVGRAVRGRPTLRREWRGARLRRGDIQRAIDGWTVHMELRQRGRRHLWVLLQRAEER